MKISLIISERLFALSILNQFKGGLDILVDILEDVKTLRVTDEEWEKADKKVTTELNAEGKPITSWFWDDVKGGEKETEITKLTSEYLVEKIKEADSKGTLTLQDKAVITLRDKLIKK